MMEELDRRFLQSQKVYFRAREQFDQGEFRRALILLRESWELHEHPPTAYWMGECHRYLKNDVAAEEWLRRAHQMRPEQATYAVGYGRFLMDRARFDEATDIAVATIVRSPNFEPAHKLLEITHQRRAAADPA